MVGRSFLSRTGESRNQEEMALENAQINARQRMRQIPAAQTVVFLLSQYHSLLPGLFFHPGDIYIADSHHTCWTRFLSLAIIQSKVKIAMGVAANQRFNTVASLNILFLQGISLLLPLHAFTTGTARGRLWR